MVTQLAECRLVLIEFDSLIFVIFGFRKICYDPMYDMTCLIRV